MSIEAVVFDIGNVLIEWNPERFYDRAIGAERRAQLFSEVPLNRMNDGVDRGEPFDAAVAATASAYTQWSEEIQMWQDHWIDMCSPAIDHSVRLMRGLRAGAVPVFALSNFGVQTFEIAKEHYPFLTEFDHRYISGHIGAVKPEPQIYELLETTCGVMPEHLLFIDDRHDNIAAARARGWHVHLFDGPDALAERLVAEGLLSEEDAK